MAQHPIGVHYQSDSMLCPEAPNQTRVGLSMTNKACKINFTRSGGFAGIILSADVDAAKEPEKVRHIATELSNLHSAAPSAEMYDRFIYTFDIVDENNDRREYVVPEDSLPASLHPVVNDLVQRAMHGAGNEES